MTILNISNWKYFAICIILSMSVACSQADYTIKDKNDSQIQTAKAQAPAGDVAVMVVYCGPNASMILKSSIDSTDLVGATAAVGRQAVKLALKFGAP